MMSKEKQIEEMARAMCDRETTCKECPVYICRARIHAANAYKAGYRKQSEGEWILQQNEKGVCSKCNRQDNMDELACFCRYCGARMKGGAE
jgi:hypothetical protein